MSDKERMQQINNYLRIIERSRMLYNTAEELGKTVGFSIGSGNGLVRKGGRSLFMKEAIFRELAFIAKEKTNLDLQEILETYIETDRLIERYGRQMKDESACGKLIRYFFADGELNGQMATIAKKMKRQHVPILVLMLQGVLPRLSAKGGDVKNIADDYYRIFSILRQTVCTNIPMHTLPALIQMEEEVRKKPCLMSRLHLIYITNMIICSYGNVSTREGLYLSNRELSENQLEPDIEGVWMEEELTTTFWEFKCLANAFNMYKYTLNSEKNELSYIKYTIRFYRQKDDSIIALATHPKSIHYLLGGQPIPNNLLAYLECNIEKDRITFKPYIDEGKWLGLSHLEKNKQCAHFEKMLNNDQYTKIDLLPEDAYDFSLALAAITEDFIYIKVDETRYYRVPKSLDDILSNANFSENIGKLELGDSTYIAFDDYNLYFDVSTEEKMKNQSIEIVECISE